MLDIGDDLFDNVIFSDRAGNQTAPLVPSILAGGTFLTFRGIDHKEDSTWLDGWSVNRLEWTQTNSIYLINVDNWETPTAHIWQSFISINPWPGIEMEAIGNNIYKVEIPIVFDRIIFNGNIEIER